MGNGNDDQRNDNHLDQIDVAAPEQLQPVGGLPDEHSLGGIRRETGHSLHGKTQQSTGHHTDDHHQGEAFVLPVIQHMDAEEDHGQHRQEQHGPPVTDHQEGSEKLTLHK